MEIGKEFIPYEQALELKELGFDDGCLTYYFIGGKMSNYFKKVHKNSKIIQNQPYKFHCTAPLYQQVARFLYTNSNKQINFKIDGKDSYEKLSEKLKKAIKDFRNLQNSKP